MSNEAKIVERIRGMRQAGYSSRAIAGELGIGVKSVKCIAKKHAAASALRFRHPRHGVASAELPLGASLEDCEDLPDYVEVGIP